MANLRFNLVQFDDTATLTVFHDGQPLVANDQHPNWERIFQGVVVDDDESVLDLFDITRAVADKFQRLGSRVTAANNRIYFDGDEVNNTLSKKIMEFVEAGVDDWKPLVLFMEKVFDNPQEHSRVQLFDWLEKHAFAINEDGDILGYKGVALNEPSTNEARNNHTYQSVTSGTNRVTVDDHAFTGRVPQSVGSVVEMARGEVQFDPAVGCSAGLHVANYRYAKGWGSVVLLVAVSPRDVVSVPTESNWEKVRVCRYRVVEVVDHDKARYEDVNPLHREVEDAPEPEVTFHGFTPGQRVVLVKDKWLCNDVVCKDQLSEMGLTVGETYTVASEQRKSLSDNNILLVEGTGDGDKRGTWVAVDAIVPVDEPDYDDEDDSWSWDDDDDDSWSW